MKKVLSTFSILFLFCLISFPSSSAKDDKFHCMTGVMDENKTLRKIFYLTEGSNRCSPGMKEKGSFFRVVQSHDLDFYCFGPMLGMQKVKYFFKVDYKSQLKSNIICNKSAIKVNLSKAQLEKENVKTINPDGILDIVGEWQGVGEYEGDSYPVYLKFFINSRNKLEGEYFYGTKYQHEEGGELLLIEDNLASKNLFKMKWYENNDSGSFNFELFPNGSLVGVWSDNYAYGGTYRISKILDNNNEKKEKNLSVVEPISRPIF